MMFDEKIGVLIVSETHLSADQTKEIQDSHIGKRLTIHNSPDPDDPSTKGIAIVLNREITNTQRVKIIQLIPGRAVLATLPWHSDRTLTILGVYAPAESMQANENFWDTLSDCWLTQDLPVPDLMGGDMNMVEEPLDRLPSREDAPRTTAALRRFKRLVGLVDGWRGENLNVKDFTYTSGRDTHSRIDRIYVSNAQLRRSQKWSIDDCTGKLSDHRMVSVTITAPGSPTIGKGRYSVPLFLLREKKFMDFVQSEMASLEDRHADNPTLNLQAEWSSLKTKIRNYAQTRAKEAIGASREKKKMLKTSRAQILEATHSPNNPDRAELPDLQTYTEAEAAARICTIQGEIDKISDVQREQRRTETRARCFTELDHITKFTVAISKDKTPRDTITRLCRTDVCPPREARRSRDMAELARDYHQDLQRDPSEQDLTTKDRDIEIALEFTEARGNPDNIEELQKQLTSEDVTLALKQAATGTASGMDGIPYELWRRLHQIHLEVTKQNAALGPDQQKRAVNITKLLASIFNDIEQKGVDAISNFSLGWMCPIWKKKDKEDIANYRPITVLNTDYKLFTKALSNKLALVAPDLVNCDQAGFMKGRKIQDQIFLAQQIVEYSEEQMMNGAIVALDQEKAYDKTNHRYLWRTLEKQGIPAKFIATIKALYTGAETVVVINGEMSSPYGITRGVRQGDPLSCLLFNLAIEPLADLIQNSKLIGIKVPRADRSIIIKMFADDTTVYLSAEDKFKDLKYILDKWCAASSAKFNSEKTEIIPLGTPEFREHLVVTQTLADSSDKIDQAHIARDGEAVRILGGYIGNNVESFALWTPTIEKTDAAQERWEKLFPTLEARRHIDQIITGSMTQYLAMVNGMPAAITKHFLRAQREFIWGGAKSSPVQRAVLSQPVNHGGKNLLDLEARNDALTVLKLQSFLDLNPKTRADWGHFADSRLEQAVTKTSRMDIESFDNLFLQTWTPKRKNLTAELQEMLRVAKKYNLSFAPVQPTQTLLREMPLFHHKGEDATQAQCNNSARCRCLRRNHGVRDIKSAIQVAERLQDETHQKSTHCDQC
ncbi:unnamed protein product [Mycena citricolor]|uniref:Reverse transcriptase domain-containing protein n=1 Tax=Mycena citricolor TaxID=2018698 RepID=A0AAD2HBX1_9AGAR|nr:unnamed protein product [Mycena citricolor]CAK5271925.1 unnamed protein product [Mycena citricolor]